MDIENVKNIIKEIDLFNFFVFYLNRNLIMLKIYINEIHYFTIHFSLFILINFT